MWGRPIESNKKRALQRPVAEANPIRFKYHEGVTDAVRRTVRIRDLL
jgi:hypothetical protein